MNNKYYDVGLVLIGNAIYALGIVLFVLPGNLLMGGTTGIALFLNHYMNISISNFVLLFNITMFIIGYFILGKKFAFKTLVSTFCYPLILKLFEHIFDGVVLTNDILLNTLFAGLFIGVAIGLVVKVGASTGGMDIPPLVLNKLFRIPVSISMYFFDCLILLGQFSFSNTERLLYGIVLIFIYTFVLEKILVLGKQKIELKIVSKKVDEIRNEILQGVDRGVTLFHGKTGYLNEECEIIMSVISSRELLQVERIIHSIDEEAFMIVSQVREVQGKGFSRNKEYK